MEWVFKRQCLTSRSSDVSNLNSDAFLDCLLNYASAASGAVKKTKKPKNQKTKKPQHHTAALKPAAMGTVGFTVWKPRSVFDDREPAEQERGQEKGDNVAGRTGGIE